MENSSGPMRGKGSGRSAALRSVTEGTGGHTAEISRAVRVLYEPGTVVELRAFSDKGSISGYFDDHRELAVQAAKLDDRGYQIYTTLNPVSPALLARAENRIKQRPKDATKDGDIVERRWLPIDLDPCRPSGISASEAEKQAAALRAAEIKGVLEALGVSDPLEADSGNGFHLLYRVDLPNDRESLDLIKGVLEALDFRFSDSAVSVDVSNSNASRIWKLYGTMARKGDSTEERPHRRSRLLEVPGTLGEATLSEVAACRW